MTDNSETRFSKENTSRWRIRLFDGRWILLAAAIILLFFAITTSITFFQALSGFVIILGATLLVPRNVDLRALDFDSDTAAVQLREQSAVQFADALSDPCFLLDQRAVVMHRNAPAESQFPGTLPGNPIAFSMRNPALLSAIDRVLASGVPENVEVHQTVPTETWFNVFVAPLNVSGRAEDAPDWVVITMHNLTEQKRIENMRADFVANASHELRTPLTSLVGFIETLLGPAAGDKEARERFLVIMRTQAERMSNLIDDLLSLSRIELRQHVKPTASINLSLTLTEVVEGLQTQAKEAGMTVSITCPEESVSVTGDREELYEVFENLLDNAIKYGADGKTVEITLEPIDRSGFDYVVNVVDHGAGIAEEHVPRLTERFYRVDAESSRKKKGTGLGLAIVKHILNRHGGQMSVRSVLGEGTTVEILLNK